MARWIVVALAAAMAVAAAGPGQAEDYSGSPEGCRFDAVVEDRETVRLTGIAPGASSVCDNWVGQEFAAGQVTDAAGGPVLLIPGATLRVKTRYLRDVLIATVER